MYKNIGSKLKGLAKFVAIMGVIFGALIALAGPSGSGAVLTGIIIGLTSFIGSWPLYGFGELIEKVSYIANKMKNEPDQHL
ncbi:MAG TPA: hypothetical protein GXZ77_07440 [Papillibacter sp.]|nr:hypothetical protein [Papillibacter sp.]